MSDDQHAEKVDRLMKWLDSSRINSPLHDSSRPPRSMRRRSSEAVAEEAAEDAADMGDNLDHNHQDAPAERQMFPL